jgi:hypothetical protein
MKDRFNNAVGPQLRTRKAGRGRMVPALAVLSLGGGLQMATQPSPLPGSSSIKQPGTAHRADLSTLGYPSVGRQMARVLPGRLFAGR